MVVRNLTRNQMLGSQVNEANSFGRRLRGLMFRSHLELGEGLLIRPCQSVHTHFMRFPIDVLFLDDDHRVVHLISAMAPWRLSPTIRGAAMVLELAAGAAGTTQVGDQLHIGP